MAPEGAGSKGTTTEHERLLGAHGIVSKGGCQRCATGTETVVHGAHAKPVQPVWPHVSGGSALWH